MRLITLFAAASAALVFADPASAQSHHFGDVVKHDLNLTVQAPPAPRPRFIVEAIGFHAFDETGPDWPGSDAVYAVFEDSANGQRRFTRTFGDVDSGESRTIGGAQVCIAPLEYAGWDNTRQPPPSWGCKAPGATGDLDFKITLYEQDGWSPMACAGDPSQQAFSKNCDDDRIGSYHHHYTAASLVTMMPHVGDTRVVTENRLGGYNFTFRLRRLQDAVDPPVILQ